MSKPPKIDRKSLKQPDEFQSKGREYRAWVANNRPAQALHKIINGVPSADMLSLRFLPHTRLADLLAYIQTLDDAAE